MDEILTVLGVVFLLAVGAEVGEPAEIAPPPNAPAEVRWNAEAGSLRLLYHGSAIVDARVRVLDSNGREVRGVGVKLERDQTLGEKVEQRLRLAPAQPREGIRLVLSGLVEASDEAFPAETPSEAQKRFECVRTSVGLSRNLRNNAIYDRRWDWALAGPPDGATRIVPKTVGKKQTAFSWESQGPAIEVVFRPRFYQKHLGFKYYQPWTYRVWKDTVSGYCTWWAYRGGFTQKTLDAMLGVFVEKRLPDFGYIYMQFDNCYQIGNGSCPQNWLTWNKRKYPGGWKYAVEVIRKAGMKPGIWVHRVHRPTDPHVRDIAAAHPDWFVRKADGSLFTARGFYCLNTTNDEAIENMVRKLYRGLKAQGWDYVKIDGTGDLLRAYMNKQCEDFFKKHPETSPELSLRKWDIVARQELGPDVYILACHSVWNARNVVGLVDGARLSNDGFQPRTLAQYNHLGGVLWRNDPDHCDVMGGWLMDSDAMMRVFGLEEPVPARSIFRPAICAMAGAVLMVSDKVEVYQDDRNIEGMKRSSPVLFTVPGQLFGRGRRPITWWLQEIDRPFDHWSVLARFQWGNTPKQKQKWEYQGLPPRKVAFADLGLPPDREYLVFEFWGQKFLGKFRGSFTAPAMDDNTAMQVFAIREARPHPWVVSTTRHISQGGVSLAEVKWDGARNVLSGRSAVVAGDPYVLTIYLPEGYRLRSAQAVGLEARASVSGPVASLRLASPTTRVVDWQVNFTK